MAIGPVGGVAVGVVLTGVCDVGAGATGKGHGRDVAGLVPKVAVSAGVDLTVFDDHRVDVGPGDILRPLGEVVLAE